jgi:non-ribosomal peptide synthase protein (TIGR01720 family)
LSGGPDDQIKLRGFRIEPGEVEAALLRQGGVSQACVVARSDGGQVARLIGYVVGGSGTTLDGGALRRSLSEVLPDHLVPSSIVVLDRFPLTANGKLDRRALPAPEIELRVGGRLPRSPQEEVLCALFAEVLGVERVGIDDNFFELGGDSIVSIQLVSRARRAGLLLTPRAVFEHQTVVGLAQVATAVSGVLAAASESAVGDLPLTAIMHWQRGRGGWRDGFNQSLLLRLPAALRQADLEAALQAVIDHHDALRLRVMAVADGELRIAVLPVGAVDARACLRRVDVVGLDETGLRGAMLDAIGEAAGRLSPSSGTMVQAVWLDAGAMHAGRLLVVIQHFAVDGVSWRILRDDLSATWAAVAAGRAPSLPERGTSFRGWALRLERYAREISVEAQLPFWRELLSGRSLHLANGSLDGARDVAGTAGHLTLRFSTAETEALLTQVPARFYGGIQEVLLSGLAVGLLNWGRRRGDDETNSIVIEVEGHGREEVFADVDLSRTVGWFTSLYPVRLDLAGIDVSHALAGGVWAGRALKRIKDQLRALPDRGLGYGLLRYLNGRTRPELEGLAAPELGFNYLGRFGFGGEADWSGASEGEGVAAEDASMPLSHCVSINALTLDGPSGAQLVANWTWAPSLLSEAEVRDLAESWFAALSGLVRHAGEVGSGGRSPSDVALAGLSQSEIEALEQRYPQLEDILPLSPLQEGLLFHALYDAQGTDLYTVQLELELAGALDAVRLRAAVDGLVSRHASLRACFVGEGLSHPVQVIVGRALVPWRELDLSGAAATEQQDQLAGIVAADRQDRFEVTSAPLLRVALIRLSADRHRLVLSSHHLLMDGWSAPLAVRDLLSLYAGETLSAVTPYRNYLAHIASRDRSAAQTYWREALSGLDAGTQLVPSAVGRAAILPQQTMLTLDARLAAELSALARRLGLTLNTVLQGAWGILLSRLSGRSDVVFGVTVAGRPAELAGVESMVGLFINTLPLRLRTEPGEPLAALLRRVQASQSESMEHQYLGLSEIKQLAGVGELFDTLLVFENYPVDRAGLAAEAAGLRLAGVSGYDATHYPLSVVVQPGAELRLRLDYRPDLFDRDQIEVLGARLVRILEGAVADAERPLHLLPILSGSERATILEEWNATAQAVSPATLPELFSAQAQRTPSAVAVVCEDRELSYAALEAHANQLAHHLRGLGVGPETVVGLCVERSVEMVIGLLGILKAGGAYLPLDPHYRRSG